MVKRRYAVIFAAACGYFCNGVRLFLQRLRFCSIMFEVVFFAFCFYTFCVYFFFNSGKRFADSGKRFTFFSCQIFLV